MSYLKSVNHHNLEELYNQFNSLPEKDTTHDSGGGGGNNGGMDSTRIIKLENFADDAKQRLTRVEIKLDNIEKEVSNFKWWLLGAIITILLTVLGTGIGIQQMTVSTFQAASSQSQPAVPTQQPPIIINIPAPAPAPAP